MARRVLPAAVLVVLILGTVPVWFPWVLKPVLARFGLRFEAYERRGYTRLALRNVRGAWRTTRFEAQRVEAVLPTTWLWQRLFPGEVASRSLTLENWRVTCLSGEGKPAPGDAFDRSMAATLEDLSRLGARLRPALPAAFATNGAVAADGWRFSVPAADWRDGTLSARLTSVSFPEQLAVIARFENESNLTLWSAPARSPVSVEGRLERAPGRGWRLNGQAVWQTNRAAFEAQFDRAGWWPARGRLEAGDWRLPAAWLPLPGYADPTFSLTCRLASARFDLEATGAVRPTGDVRDPAWPRLDLALHAAGEPDLVLMDKLEIRGPGLAADLTNRIGLSWTGGVLTNAAQFQVEFDPAQVPGCLLTGKVNGAVEVEWQTNRVGAARLELAAARLGFRSLEARRLSASGRFDWPTLRVDRVEASFEDGTLLSGSGLADFSTNQAVQVRWSAEGGQLKRWFSSARSGSWRAAGELGGVLTNLAHSGEITLANAQFQSMPACAARAEWTGTNLDFSSTKLELQAGASRLAAAGAMRLGDSGPELRLALTEATLQRGGASIYSLARPCAIRFRGAAADGVSTNWTLAVEGFDWAGRDSRLSFGGSMRWPREGQWQARANDATLAPFAEFLPPGWAGVVVTNLAVEAQWSNGPVRSRVSLAAGVRAADGRSYGMLGNARTGERVEFEPLTLTTESTPALIVTGSLPLSFVPGGTNGGLRVDEREALALRADLQAVDELSLPLARVGVLKLRQPRLQLVAAGTLDRPSSTLTATVARLEWEAGAPEALRPKLEQLRLEAAIAPEKIALRSLRGAIDGEAMQAQGEWPLPPGFWKELATKGPSLDWSNAQGRVQVENARVATFARYAPSLLAPEGRVSLDLALAPGAKLDGLVILTNAATRPLGALSALRDVAARARFTRGEATLEEFSGEIGGQPVRASGKARLAAGGMDYQLKLQGSNVPLARTVELLLRGDLDLQLAGGPGTPPRLSGQVKLRDGLFVEYASALLQSQPQRPTLRPPYWRYTNAPLADWQLEVSLRGDQFLRVRTPVFNGIVSANLKAGGTLREPVLTGDARVSSGRVIFPFGTLQVNQGHLSFDGEDPRGPDVLVHASGRNYRYEVRLELSGKADGARVTFASTPPLTSEEILLMLTAGEVPSNELVFSTRARAGRLATFLGTDLLSRYTGGAGSSDRLIINTAENVSDEGKTTYSVEYRLTDRWSLLGEYDRFGAVNAAIKWRLLTR